MVPYPAPVARKNKLSLCLSLLRMCAGTDIGRGNIQQYSRLQVGAQPGFFLCPGGRGFGPSGAAGQSRPMPCVTLPETRQPTHPDLDNRQRQVILTRQLLVGGGGRREAGIETETIEPSKSRSVS